MLTRASLAARLARLEKRACGVGAVEPRALICIVPSHLSGEALAAWEAEWEAENAPPPGTKIVTITLGGAA
jgi:hypothetical protein